MRRQRQRSHRSAEGRHQRTEKTCARTHPGSFRTSPNQRNSTRTNSHTSQKRHHQSAPFLVVIVVVVVAAVIVCIATTVAVVVVGCMPCCLCSSGCVFARESRFSTHRRRSQAFRDPYRAARPTKPRPPRRAAAGSSTDLGGCCGKILYSPRHLFVSERDPRVERKAFWTPPFRGDHSGVSWGG